MSFAHRPIILLFLLSFLFDQALYACSCANMKAPCMSFRSADAVFVGKVIKVMEIERETAKGLGTFTLSSVASFSVQRVYRGQFKSNKVQIETGYGGGDCGYGFNEGESFLVYAYRNHQTDKLETSICTRTRPLDMAEEDLDFLNGLPKSNSATTISGTIFHVGNELNNFKLIGPLKKTHVIITGEGRRFEAITNEKGVYKLTDLPAGNYTLTLDLPPHLISSFQKEFRLTLTTGNCTGTDISVQSNGMIRGRVVDANGNAALNVKVEIVSSQKNDRLHNPRDEYLFSRSKWDFTDADGRFQITKIPPGRYLLGIDITNPASKELKEITIGDGEVLEGIDLKLLSTATHKE